MAIFTSGTNSTTFITAQTLSHSCTQNMKSVVSSIASCHSDRSNQDEAISLANDQLDVQIFNAFITILYMYMFRAISCSSSGGQIVLIQQLVSSLSVSDRPVHRLSENWLQPCSPDGHLLRVTIPDAVLIQFDLLRMSKILLETCTCRGL